MSSANAHDLSFWDASPDLFLFTSLTSGSSHIFTATSRLETILKANRIPFRAIDLATDESARRLWQRRSGGKRKLPALVKEGFVVGDIDEVEELNEFGELKAAVGVSATAGAGSGIGASKAPGAGAAIGATLGTGLGHAAGTAPPPNTKATTPAAGVEGKDKEQDPMRDLAAQAASIGLERQKGPKVLVGEEKIRPLQAGLGVKEAAAAAAEAGKGGVEGEVKPVAETDATSAPVKKESEEVEEKSKTSDPVTGEAVKSTSVLDDDTKPETMTNAVDKKEESVETASAAASTGEDKSEDRPEDKLGAAPSTTSEAITSSDSLAPATSTTSLTSTSSVSITTHHRGSEVRDASPEEIKEIEDGNTITEQDGEDESDEKDSTKVDATTEKLPAKVDDTKSSATTAEKVEAKESAKAEDASTKKPADGDAAGVSVED
ncbi:putative SH3-binding protein [Elsinoe fawcettii]|nr:putative SH3-binding protein [Elsinoe fawcettii]